jgi:tRNA nucleotidyltransferase (CCA-adding enzyme)
MPVDIADLEIYLVGGAVRDKLLGLGVKDRDWVVVGATPDDMTARGFRPVGKDFPVFLHPDTNEEYALARTERKVAPGYKGFVFNTSPEVTLEQDLARRDLTINAMAETPDGGLVDPFGGADDLRAGILRHVSEAFAEDPVRILRVARFAARYTRWGFRVAHGTNKLMKRMVENGEVDALVPERVWAELQRALEEPRPSRFFHVLRRCGALARVFPEIDALYGIPQPEKHHPEIDTGVHAMLVLDAAAQLTPDPQVRFAALMHDIGKGGTPEEEWPRHIDHEARGVDILLEFCRRLRVPNDYRDLAVLACRYHGHCHRADELAPSTLLGTLEALDAFRKPARLEQFLLACMADARGRSGHENAPYPQADTFRHAFGAANDVDAAAIAARGLSGEAMRNALHEARVGAIKHALGARG